MKIMLFIFVYLVMLKVFLEPLFPFFVSILIYILIRPSIIFFSQKFNIKKNTVGFIILILFFIIITLVFCYIIMKSYTLVDVNINDYSSYLSWFLELDNIVPDIHDILLYIIEIIVDNISKLITFIPSIFFFVMIMCLSSFYLVFEQDYIKKMLLHFTDIQTYNMIKKFALICNRSILDYCKIQFIIMILTFLMLWVVMMALDIRYALLYSFVLSILDCFPFLGIGIGLIPLMFIFVIQHMYLKCLYIFLVFLFLSLLRSLIETTMMKNIVKIPSVIILVSMIIHIYVYGITGVILSILHMNIIYGYLEYRKNYSKMI